MLDTLCSEVVWRYWLPTPFTSFPFTSPPVRHRIPSHFSWSPQSLPGDGNNRFRTEGRYSKPSTYDNCLYHLVCWSGQKSSLLLFDRSRVPISAHRLAKCYWQGKTEVVGNFRTVRPVTTWADRSVESTCLSYVKYLIYVCVKRWHNEPCFELTHYSGPVRFLSAWDLFSVLPTKRVNDEDVSVCSTSEHTRITSITRRISDTGDCSV
jgi:hypothetical protein